MKFTDLDSFTRSYITTALWSSTDNSDPETGGDPMDQNYGPEDIEADTLAKMAEDCAKFQADNAEDLGPLDLSTAGHDFWLTRNGHGAGFWDGDYEEKVGERLTTASKAFGGVDLYVGDDGTIYA